MRPWQSISLPTFSPVCFCFGRLVSLGWDCLPHVCIGPGERSPESLIPLTTNKFFFMDQGAVGFLKLWMEQRDFDPTDPHKQVLYLFCHSQSIIHGGAGVGIVIWRHAGLSHAVRSSLYHAFLPLQCTTGSDELLTCQQRQTNQIVWIKWHYSPRHDEATTNASSLCLISDDYKQWSFQLCRKEFPLLQWNSSVPDSLAQHIAHNHKRVAVTDNMALLGKLQ